MDDETKYLITQTLPYSGYTVEILPLPPHYMDVVEELYPLQDYPQREVILMAGDTIFYPYEPTESPPDKDTNPEDYDLWYRWHAVDNYNVEVKTIRNKARVDLLYSLCVNVVDGIYKVEDEEWVTNLEAPFHEDNVRLNLTHPGYRKLMFIKTQVIRHMQEKNLITRTAMYEEVGMQGIEAALRGFRADLGQRSAAEAD